MEAEARGTAAGWRRSGSPSSRSGRVRPNAFGNASARARRRLEGGLVVDVAGRAEALADLGRLRGRQEHPQGFTLRSTGRCQASPSRTGPRPGSRRRGPGGCTCRRPRARRRRGSRARSGPCRSPRSRRRCGTTSRHRRRCRRAGAEGFEDRLAGRHARRLLAAEPHRRVDAVLVMARVLELLPLLDDDRRPEGAVDRIVVVGVDVEVRVPSSGSVMSSGRATRMPSLVVRSATNFGERLCMCDMMPRNAKRSTVGGGSPAVIADRVVAERAREMTSRACALGARRHLDEDVRDLLEEDPRRMGARARGRPASTFTHTSASVFANGFV